ncbi:unnamed protein product [Lupinus luteus]|uniref:Dirigent protein n=1 Tax=Lupinus luteus TaxID=3873 RepID=A0AAV1W6J2_LUPLU
MVATFIYLFIYLFMVAVWFMFSLQGRKMNFQNVKVPNVVGSGAASALLKLAIVGGNGLYAAANGLYNIEGGRRATVCKLWSHAIHTNSSSDARIVLQFSKV